jgi:AcrR family transcriptional regulator
MERDPRIGRRPRQTVQRILETAARVVGARGLEGLQLAEVARAAGVPLGLLRYHFRSREHLLIETQRATFRAINERFEERFAAGDQGVETAMEALDALWHAVRDMYPWAPFMVQTMALAARDRALGDRLSDFNAEALARVELGLVRLFTAQLHRMALPPDRLARAVRTGLYGLVVELACARTPEERELVDQTYRDVRGLLKSIVLEAEPGLASVH